MFIARVATKQIQLVTKYSHRVSVSRHRYESTHLWLYPSHCIKIKNFDIVKAFISIVATKHVKFATNTWHRVASSCARFLTAYFWLRPNKTNSVQHVKIIKPLVTIMASMKVDFIAIYSSSVIVSTGGFWPESFRFASTNQIVEIKYIEIIERFLSVPATKYIKEVSNLVTRVRCSTTRRIVLGKRCIPSHNFK